MSINIPGQQGVLGVSPGLAAQGWQCPLCKRILNPTAQYCPFHPVAQQVVGETNIKQAGGVAQGDPFHNLPKSDKYV